MSYRVLVGGHAMCVECHGIRSEQIEIGEQDTPEIVRKKGADLWQTIRHLVLWEVWVRHRLRTAQQRKTAALVANKWPGPYYPGPRPDLIAQRPWTQAVIGQWASLPHGVVARLVRGSAQ